MRKEPQTSDPELRATKLLSFRGANERRGICLIPKRPAGKSRSFVVPLRCGGTPQDDEWRQDQPGSRFESGYFSVISVVKKLEPTFLLCPKLRDKSGLPL